MNQISVIVPTFNRASLIGRALMSLLAQTHHNIEAIVVDDGSTDETADVVARFATQSDTKIIYERQDNAGCAAARNHGLRVARGDLIAFLDSDDAWLPTAAETMSAALIESGADFVYSPALEVYSDGRERLNLPVAACRPWAFAVEHFKDTNLRNGAFMFRRSVLSSVGWIDESLLHNEDSDFVQRVAVRHTAAYSEDPTVRVYHHETNKSRNRAEIYHALLQSAQRVVTENPGFAAELGEAAKTRVDELQTKYIEELILAGKYKEARNYTRGMDENPGPAIRVALLSRSVVPLKARDRALRSKMAATGRIRSIFRLLRSGIASVGKKQRL